ncbi:hypothetical protein CR513_54662, partial [Mucuna pruriens]
MILSRAATAIAAAIDYHVHHMLDLGASNHIVGNPSLLLSLSHPEHLSPSFIACTCKFSKSHSSSFRSPKLVDLVNMFGPSFPAESSIRQIPFFLLFIQMCATFAMKFKFKSIRILLSDNAREFFYKSFNNIMASHNIMVHQSNCPYTPQQNGIAKRIHRHIIEIACTLLIHANSPIKYAFFIFDNRMPHSLLFLDEPLYKVPPRDFGSTCFVHSLTPGLDKLKSHAIKDINVILLQVIVSIYQLMSLMSPSVKILRSSPLQQHELISQVLPVPPSLPFGPNLFASNTPETSIPRFLLSLSMSSSSYPNIGNCH